MSGMLVSATPESWFLDSRISMQEKEMYDGIWACASVLHVPKIELANILQKMCNAVKVGGIIYTSFKYGNFEGERSGRFFCDFTEKVSANL